MYQLAMEPMQIIPAEALSGKYADENRPFQGIPTIARTPGGTLMAAWYSGGVTENGDNFVLLYESRDNGENWQPVLAVDRPGDKVRAFDPDLWVDPQGRLWLFWAQCYDCTEYGGGSNHDGRGGVWCIRCDAPDTLPRQFTAPRRIADGIMMNKPTVRRDGAWLLPCAVWNYDDQGPNDLPEQRYSNVYISEDNGESFRLYGHSAWADRLIDEHMLVEKRDGTLWMLIRGKSWNFHDRLWDTLPDGSRRLTARGGVGESFSYDGGKTWSHPHDSGFGGPCSRFHIRRLASGRLLLVNHFDYQNGDHASAGWSPRCNLTAMVSDNDGYSWKGFLMLDERPGVSYPDMAEAPDGTLYIIYDYDRTGDKTILMARITEEDILAGKLVSDGSQLRMLVNQSFGKK